MEWNKVYVNTHNVTLGRLNKPTLASVFKNLLKNVENFCS